MKIFLSPAKKMSSERLSQLGDKRYYLDEKGTAVAAPFSTPPFREQASQINGELSCLTDDEIKKLFHCNEKKCLEIRQMIGEFDSLSPVEALAAFRGVAYQALDCDSLSESDLHFANQSLYILSGLYGILSPLDLIHTYRLDFNDKLKVDGLSLKKFWSPKINDYLAQNCEEGELLVNLASKEYSSILSSNFNIYNLHFEVYHQGVLKKSTVWSKQARGAFAKALIVNQVVNVEGLQKLVVDGYSFEKGRSDACNGYFVKEI